MMKSNKLIIQINKSVDEIFDFVITPPNLTLWIKSIANEETNEWPIKIGTIYKLWDEKGNINEMIVVDINNNEMVEWISNDQNYHCRYIFKNINKDISEFEYYEWTDEGELKEPFTIDILEKLKFVIENQTNQL